MFLDRFDVNLLDTIHDSWIADSLQSGREQNVSLSFGQ